MRMFPRVRLRRLRRTERLREMVAETSLSVSDLIYPVFVDEGIERRVPIRSMPGQSRLPVSELRSLAEELVSLGIPAVILFGIPAKKDAEGRESARGDGVVQRAVRELKRSAGDELVVITDVCLCEYTTHGHCGVVEGGEVLNDPTLEILARQAVSHAEAGADVVAPSDMMDGRVGAIRQALDDAGFERVAIMSYSAKYASSFYSPFRDAAKSAPAFGDRRSYQMDFRNAREALREVEQDVAEGADIVMVKPALAYLDVIARVRERFSLPVAAYNVSGEYAMVKAASAAGYIDERSMVLEVLTAIKRAGADLILTYHALDAARWLEEVR
ncbi:MAG: porphobilinogen synthase [Euryarchaeota archaeon]|nr:porphobilinogen synthase [Euryarchaeota archaeon]